MGNWNINIQGVGAHHNTNNDGDADKLAQKFVQELIDAGQFIDHATFTSGSKTQLEIVKPT